MESCSISRRFRQLSTVCRGNPRRSRIAGAGGDELPQLRASSAAHGWPVSNMAAICDRARNEIRGDTAALGGGRPGRWGIRHVDGDEVLLRQAFSNLLRNAFEACAGASVSSTRRDSRERGSVATRRPNRRQRQRPRHCPRRLATGSSARSTRPNATARAGPRGSCRRLSCFTTGR